MPELPEVETIRLSLSPYVKGLKIERVIVRDPHVLGVQVPSSFISHLEGLTLNEIKRYGKVLFFPLKEYSLVFRLGMTGQLTIRLPSREDTAFNRHQKTGLQKALQHAPDKHTHISLELSEGISLQYRDIRKFGRVLVVPVTNYEGIIDRFSLGADPLSPDYSYTYLKEKLSKKKAPIKAVLLDQTVLAGLGNIYVDEALFLAGINPKRPAVEISESSLRLLFKAIPKVLQQGVDHGGTTLRDYVNGLGKEGSNQEELFAYGRYGKPCLKCGQVLCRETVGGRTTSWCPNCQS